MTTLAYEEALRRLGPALFPGEWVGRLTARETWLLEQAGYFASSILPGGVFRGGAEAQAARERHELMRWQYTETKAWLGRHGIKVVRQSVDREKFERALAAVASPAKKKGGNRAYKDDAVVAEVRELVKSGKARSMAAAARRLLPRIEGAGTPEAKIERIRRKAAKGQPPI